MKDRNIKDTFESLCPSQEQKGEIYKSITEGQDNNHIKTRAHVKAKFAIAAIACLILAVSAAILLDNTFNNDSVTLLEPEKTQYNKEDSTPSTENTPLAGIKPSEENSLPVATDNKTVFNGFVLTALTTNGSSKNEKTVLTPDVKVLLAQYDPGMSSVPGLPFTVDITEEDKEESIETINVSTDRGAFYRWNRSTGVVTPCGQQITIDKGETIYWSPISNKEDANAMNITITVEAVANNAIVGRQYIYITQDEVGYYYATVGELELA